jgi:hypothetical protein
MATWDEQRRQKFNDQFNELVGNKNGNVRKNYSSKTFDSQITPEMRSMIAGLTSKKKKAPKIAGTTTSEELSLKPSTDPVRSAQVLELVKSMEGVRVKAKDKGFLDSVGGGLVKAVNVIPKGITNTVGNGLELLGRPGNTVTNALYQGVNAVKEGEPFYSIGDDIAYGARRGITGKDHYGIGHIEEMADTKKDTPLWVKRLIGFTGDVAFDPTTFFSFGVTTAVRNGSKQALKKGGMDAVNHSVNKAVREAVDGTAISKATRVNVLPNKMRGKGVTPVVDDVVDNVVDRASKMIYEVRGGPNKGKVLGGHAANRSVAQAAREEVRSTYSNILEKKIKEFTGSIEKGKPLSQARLATLKEDPLFAAFYEAHISNFKRTQSFDDALIEARQAAAKALNDETDVVFNKVIGALDSELARVPTLRVRYKKGLVKRDFDYLEIPIPVNKIPYDRIKGFVGRNPQAARMGDTLSKSKTTFQKTFSYSHHLPGVTSNLAQSARSNMTDAFKAFRKQVVDISHGVSKEDARLLQRYTSEGIDIGTVVDGPAGERLQEVQNAIRELNQEMWEQELQAGIRKGAKAVKAENYAYYHIKGRVTHGSSKERFLEARKQAFLKNGNHVGFGVEAAKKAGLKVEEDIFKNLLYRKAKQGRQLTRHYFRVDLVNHFGIRTRSSVSEARTKGLKEVAEKDLPAGIELKPGERIVIDSDIEKVYKDFSEMLKRGADEDILWVVDKMTRFFKIANTLPYPAFHVRNMISDFFMGAMDGVKPKDYTDITSKWFKRGTSTIKIGGEDMAYMDLLGLYEKHAASGTFMDTDINIFSKRADVEKTVPQVIGDPRNWPQGLVKMSEKREDWGRLVHFKRALDDELTAAKLKYKDPQRALDAAVQAAVFRVNKYKFDYSALTRAEKGVMKRVMPFYTYLRKAAPTILEAALISPSHMGKVQNFLENYAPSEDGNRNMLLPDYLEKGGFAQLTDGDSPYGFTASVLPTNIFKDLSTNPVDKLTPLIQGLFEAKSKKDTFTGKKIDGGWDMIKSNIRVFPLIDNLTKADKSRTDKLLNFFGIPLTHVTEQMQDSQFTSLRYQLKDNLTKLDDYASEKGFKVYLSERGDGVTIRVKDSTGRVVSEFSSFKEAADFIASV